jgi:hypothetical protein
MLEIEPSFLGHPVYTLFNIPTDLSRFILCSDKIGRMGEFEMWEGIQSETVDRRMIRKGDMVTPTPTPFHKNIFSWQKQRSVALLKCFITVTIL